MDRSRVLLMVAAALSGISGAGHGAVSVPTNFVNETIVQGLDSPLGMAFLPDGRLLLTEQRTGKVRLVVNGHIAVTDPVLTVASLNSSGLERGLQGIAVDPGWPGRPYVYLIYNRTGNFLRLVRYTASGDLSNPSGESLTLGTPLLLIDNMPDVLHNHNGGTLRFGPDGHLYASIGDDDDNCAAQDSTLLKGQVLRLRVTQLPAGGGGPVPKALLIPTAPALSSPDSNARMVYAYGLRNPWRFQIDPANGLIYLGDVGEDTYEELDEIRTGDNLGWPYREGSMIRSPGSCSEPGGSGRGGYDGPILTLNHSTGSKAIIPAGVYRPVAGGANWPPEYYGDVFYSDYFPGFIRRLKNSEGWSTPAAVPGQPNSVDWATGLTSPVDFGVGPDGNLWWLSQSNSAGAAMTGSVQRIRYTGTPTAVAGHPSGAAGLRGAPNPFAAVTELSFALPRPERVRLDVFDTRGRNVRRLLDGVVSSGATRVAWDGTDRQGSAVAPGLYFVRLDHAGSSETLRLFRVR